MAKRTSLCIFGSQWLASCLLLTLLLVGSRAHAVEQLDGPTIRAMVQQLNSAAANRDIGPWEARLAPECDIAVQVTVFGALRTSNFSRREYLDMTTRAWSELAKHNLSYGYTGGPVTIRLESGSEVAIVTGKSTETMTYPDGKKLETSSMNTMRVELRDGRLVIVSISAVSAL